MLVRALVTLVLITAPALAQTDKERNALSNVHHEAVICMAYYGIMKQCLENNPKGQSAAEQTGKVIENLTQFTFRIGTNINMTADAMASRLKLAMEEQMSLIRHDCVNASSLMTRYAARCKVVVENPDSILLEYMK